MSNCKEILMTDYEQHRCSRKAKRDGYCEQHHPESVKKRQDDSERRRKEKHEKSPLAVAQREIAELRQREIDLEKELHLSLIQRDQWEEKATTLAMAVGENCGIDVGEHSSDNCPVMTALEALGQ